MSSRDPGSAFRYEDTGFIDFETRSPVDIDAGTYRYMGGADALIWAYAIGDAPAVTVSVPDYSCPLRWADMPDAVKRHHDKVLAGKAIWAAYHAAFDRAAWNYATVDFPLMAPEHIIDVMVQTSAAGLPQGLGDAAKFAGCSHKAPTGRALIELFCLGGGGRPETHPIEWQQFNDYAAQDVEVMRELFLLTLQLSEAEWQEYWAAERINARGVGVDLGLAKAAARMAAIDAGHMGAELKQLSGGAVAKVTETAKMIRWLRRVLDPDCIALMTRREAEVDEDTGEEVKPRKDTLTRARLRQLIVRLAAKEGITDIERRALRMLEIRHYGGSTTPAKFGRMLEQEVDGVLMGQYTFGGAPQTGRFSSRGVQIHNLMRSALRYEIDALDALVGGCSHEAFQRLGDDAPVSRKLSMLVRAALVPTEPNHCFVWDDFSQIEARVLPWLADSPEAEARLDIFREVDADPTLPDLYVRSVAAMMKISVDEVDETLRQRGKVAELACGFGGGRGALQNMAANYDMALDDTQASEIVAQWREANPWAVAFWGAHRKGVSAVVEPEDEDPDIDHPGALGSPPRQSYGLWGAANRAIEAPGTEQVAGRVMYIFVPDYLGGSLLCKLPSGRFLTYRKAKWETVHEKDDDGIVISSSYELTFARGYGRVKMWPGFLAENVTQAVAADVLRGTLTRLDRKTNFDVRAHTHDEVLVQCPEEAAGWIAKQLTQVMEEGFDWSEGLPLKAEPTVARWYSKCKGAYGL
jgi:DNA polymerase